MVEKEVIEAALKEHWHIRPAADSLNIGYSTLCKYIKDYGIKHNSRKKRDGPTFNRLAYQSAKMIETRQSNKVKLLEYKGGMKCVRCGFDEQIPDCYAFHHRDPLQKDKNWVNWRSQPLEKSKKEIDKCDVLCHNCHSIVHYLGKV